LAFSLASALFLVRFWLVREPAALTLSAPVQVTRDSGLTTDPVVSKDGKLLAYASDRGGEGNLDIWVQHIPGGDARRLTSDAAADHEPDISPDGSQVIFRSERDGGGVYSVSALGGLPRLLIKGAYVPRFSPDGSQIAYAQGVFGGGGFHGKLMVHTLATGATQILTPETTAAGPAGGSPDGKRLAFVGEAVRGGPVGLHIWSCSPAGGPASLLSVRPIGGTQLLFGQARTMPVAWFGDRIILSMNLGDSSNLWAGAVSPGTYQLTGELKRITIGSGNEVMPSISANGMLVFASPTDSADIWEADPGKPVSAMRRLTNGRARNLHPSVSADGSKLAYISDRSGDFDVWTKDLATGVEAAVARTPNRETSAVISRDGSQIASWDGADTYVTPTLGGASRLLCKNCGRPEDWTPDGSLIAWLSALGSRKTIGGVGVRNIATGQLTQVLADESLSPIAPALSPDGRWLVFHVQKGEMRQIFLAPYTGQLAPQSSWRQLTDGTALDREARWSADGKRVYFLSDRDGFRCIWARTLDPKSKQPLESPYAALHLHDARLSLSHVANTGQVGISARGRNVIFSMGELTGNIWAAEIRLR
ncbi:MAG: hypothetical protein ACKV2U_04640, partial [Bryobacteraceae bacterium]